MLIYTSSLEIPLMFMVTSSRPYCVPTALEAFWPWHCVLGSKQRHKVRMGLDMLFIYTAFFNIYICFLGTQLRHKEVPRLGVESELQLPVYTTVTTMQDPGCICNLHQSSQQWQILSPLREARDWTPILMDIVRLVTTEAWWELHNFNFLNLIFTAVSGT